MGPTFKTNNARQRLSRRLFGCCTIRADKKVALVAAPPEDPEGATGPCLSRDQRDRCLVRYFGRSSGGLRDTFRVLLRGRLPKDLSPTAHTPPLPPEFSPTTPAPKSKLQQTLRGKRDRCRGKIARKKKRNINTHFSNHSLNYRGNKYQYKITNYSMQISIYTSIFISYIR